MIQPLTVYILSLIESGFVYQFVNTTGNADVLLNKVQLDIWDGGEERNIIIHSASCKPIQGLTVCLYLDQMGILDNLFYYKDELIL